MQNGGKGMSRQFYTHCRREFLHQQLDIIFDQEFMHAYQHGLVFQCQDGVQRRFYPRIFTYSADYPEKYVNIISKRMVFNLISSPEFCLPLYVVKADAHALVVLFQGSVYITLVKFEIVSNASLCED